MISMLLWLLALWLPLLNPPVQSRQVFAVVVGISDYQATSYFSGDLRYADADARRVARFLQSRAGGSVPSANIRLLVNNQATKRAIVNALDLFNKAKPGDKIVFYFSGHGAPNCFIPYDIKLNSANLNAQLFTHDLLKQAFRASAASTKLCVADACYAGSMATQQTQYSIGIQPTDSKTNTGTNTALILATRSNQTAVEAGKLQGGIFTYFLLQGLQGRADVNRNRIVTIRELYRYVTPRMRQAMPKNPKGQLEAKSIQAPLFYGNFSDDLPIAELQ